MAEQRVLVIDDEAVVGLTCRRVLGPEGYEVSACEEATAGLQAALSGQFEVILLDLFLPGADSLDLVRRIKAAGVATEIVVMIHRCAVDQAMEAAKHGAADFICKPISPEQLKTSLRKVLTRSGLLQENAALRQELEIHLGCEGVLGESRAMQRVVALIRRAALTEETVLITGEPGTGEESVARAIHRLSRRKDGPFLACDCAALTPPLLESELFGHVKDVASGGTVSKEGLLALARRGTLFLHEVAGLSWTTQEKLLRAMETGRVAKLGGTSLHPLDVRILSATHRDLDELVRSGSFHPALLERLSVIPIPLPPLRERPGDIPLLAMAFLEPFCRRNQLEVRCFAPDAIALLEAYPWPGNVRQLRTVVQRAAVLCDGPRIELGHLPPEICQAAHRSGPPLPRTWTEFRKLTRQVRDEATREMERRFLVEALERSGGNVSKAAEDVGIQRTNFHSLMRKHGLGADMLRTDDPGRTRNPPES